MDANHQPIGHDYLQGEGASGELQQTIAGADVERPQLEEELRNTRAELEAYRTLYNKTPCIHFTLDSEGVVVGVNQFGAARLGYSVQELVGKTIFSTFAPDEREKLKAEFAQFLQQAIQEAFELSSGIELNALVTSWELRACCKDGSIFWVNVTASIVRRTNTDRVVLLVCDDITERKQAQERLHLLEQVLRDCCNGIVLTDSNQPDNPIIYINPSFERLTGYSAEEIIGYNCRFLQGADTAQPALDELRMAIREARECHVTLRNYRKDGTLFWNELYLSPIGSPQGNLIGFVGIQTDITERKQAEEALSKSEAKNRALISAIPDLIFRISKDSTYLDVKAARDFDTFLPAQEFLGKKLDEVLPTEVAEKAKYHVEQALSTNEIQIFEYQLPKNGNLHDYEARLVVSGEDEVLVIVRDISDRKAAEESLRQQTERERLLRAMLERIRQSLNLDEILNTTVSEVRQFLASDRVIVFRFQPDWSGVVVVESVANGWTPILGTTIHDPCFEQVYVQYQQGRTKTIEDIYTAELSQCHIDLLHRLQVRASLIVPILQGEELWGLLIAHDCSQPRQWQQLEIDLLCSLATQVAIAIQQAELYNQMQQQAQREQALNRSISEIRSSLELEVIFATATTEIGQLLHIDHVSILQYLPQRQVWLNVALYYQGSSLSSRLGMEFPDVDNLLGRQLKQLQVVSIHDTQTIEDEGNKPLAEAYPGAWLLVPIHFQGNLWGILTLSMEGRPRYWQDSEVDLVCAFAAQLAIAIGQSTLFKQVQQLNANLERQVQQRTTQLQKALGFEAVLKRITDKVRDSLDESQILQVAVRELALSFNMGSCHASLYNLEQETATICYEYATSMPSSQGQVMQMADFPEIYAPLRQGKCFQSCSISPDFVRSKVAMLACPILDDQGVLGDLWLFHRPDYTFKKLEIRLVQQVANQCAIAIRQARFYQASLAQVEELEKLNRLKDEFLSTVSHELRSPVSNMKMAAQMLEITLKREGVLDAKIAKPPTEVSKVSLYLQILQKECKRETDLINDLLDLQRLEAGTRPLDLDVIELHLWLPQIVKPFQERAQNRQQILQVDIPSQLPRLVSDSSSLERILAELLNNACKYTPPGEKIVLTAEAKSGTLQLSVKNSGAEIPQSELTRIFDKFYRVPNADPWKQGGTGLGLALVKKLTEHLGGEIWVESGSGQTGFIIELPINFAYS
ncbi:PAS domain S-box protein [Trichocoleus sp. DQ-A3]|uniref:GAF domain-containing protein n=1 Tax=Cyanophyceae TaxID=3028117 RepID=UPI0016867AC5|nr:GAF domain-containing protein [Coleofasciculus sp. FACHB-125]MBD1900420.1 PAS domain S-box protein [Coleofasciculus sp. FACHB-125]